jgi:hypothetical protein
VLVPYPRLFSALQYLEGMGCIIVEKPFTIDDMLATIGQALRPNYGPNSKLKA